MAHQYFTAASKHARVPVYFPHRHCREVSFVLAYCDRTSRHCDHNFQAAEELVALMESV